MPQRIVRLLSVVDTRQYEEVGDRWVPIPGSGLARDCARCGRQHEVHAEVLLEDGRTAVVGTGCAERSTMDPAVRAAVSSGDRAAKRLASLRAKLEGMLARNRAWDAGRVEVEALELPPLRVVPAESDAPAHHVAVLTLGTDADNYMVQFRSESRSDLEAALVRRWRDQQMRARGLRRHAEYEVEDLRRSIAQLERRLSSAGQ